MQRVYTSVRSKTTQTLTLAELSSSEAKLWLTNENTIKGSVWAGLHNLTVLSHDDVKSHRPSWPKLTLVTDPSWPKREKKRDPFFFVIRPNDHVMNCFRYFSKTNLSLEEIKNTSFPNRAYALSDRSITHSLNLSINQSINQSIDQSINQSINNFIYPRDPYH